MKKYLIVSLILMSCFSNNENSSSLKTVAFINNKVFSSNVNGFCKCLWDLSSKFWKNNDTLRIAISGNAGGGCTNPIQNQKIINDTIELMFNTSCTLDTISEITYLYNYQIKNIDKLYIKWGASDSTLLSDTVLNINTIDTSHVCVGICNL